MDSELRGRLKKKSFKRFFKSFKFAFDGIVYAFRNEQNIIVHMLVTLLVALLGFLLKISFLEWLLCIVLCGLVIASELINTAIEATVDLACFEDNKLAKIAKDTASGAVLIFAITSFIVGTMIFFPKIMNLLK